MLTRLRLLILAALLPCLAGCPPRNSAWEPPAFPETASNSYGPAAP